MIVQQQGQQQKQQEWEGEVLAVQGEGIASKSLHEKMESKRHLLI